MLYLVQKQKDTGINIIQTLIRNKAKLTLEKVDSRVKKIATDKERHYNDKRIDSLRNGKHIQLPICQAKTKRNEIRSGKSSVVVEDFSIPLLVINRTGRLEIS